MQCDRRHKNSNLRFVYTYKVSMKAARQFGIVILLLASYLTPAMACMVSDVPMNAAERACCRVMKNRCEQMGMPSHGCCQKAPRSAHDNALDTKAITSHPIAVVTVWLVASEWFNPAPSAAGWVESVDYSPPYAPPGSISILRI